MGILMRNEINYSGNSSSSPTTTSSLSNLTDVEITSLANGQGLFYDEELQKWVNGDVASGGSTSSTTGTLKPWLYDSDNEIVIGVYDGKPLYRKKVNIVLPSTAYEYTSILHNISDVEEIFINHNYSYLVMENGSRIPINAVRPSSSTNINGGMSIWSMAGAENISVVIGGTYVDCAAVFTLEYTKTTDAEGSGEGLMPYGVGGGSSLVNYSTEEQVIGKWIDGRDLYQKTYDITGISINANTWYDYIIDNTGIDFVTKIEGYRVSSGKTQTYPMNQYKTSDASLQGCTFLYNADLPAIAIRPTSANTDTGIHWYVTIQYVKTTDTTT